VLLVFSCTHGCPAFPESHSDVKQMYSELVPFAAKRFCLEAQPASKDSQVFLLSSAAPRDHFPTFPSSVKPSSPTFLGEIHVSLAIFCGSRSRVRKLETIGEPRSFLISCPERSAPAKEHTQNGCEPRVFWFLHVHSGGALRMTVSAHACGGICRGFVWTCVERKCGRAEKSACLVTGLC
jgi:hypothetical protein